MDVASLADLSAGRRLVALTGAGCSTESGIPDYRGVDTPPRVRAPIQHREFVDKEPMRRRYWARSFLGWPRLSGAQPNAAHHALTELERAGALAGIITQNVDSLHTRAGSQRVVELHGALARVICLACGELTTRQALQHRLAAANHTWLRGSAPPEVAPGSAELGPSQTRPDGDVDLADALVEQFQLVACAACGGVLMPDVVFFGGSVPRATLDAAWALFDEAELLLVVGSSLTVFSGYRFVRRAAERGVPVAILNRGPTRGDEHACLRLDLRCGEALPALVRALDARPPAADMPPA